MRIATLAVVFASVALAQTPDAVHFTLAARDGKTTFRLGEAIEVELQFTSSIPGDYAAWTTWPDRTTRKADYDNFTAEPSDGVVDPLAETPAQIAGHGVAGRPPTPAPLTPNPVTVGLQVNQWLAFRKPGRYRITAESTRVVATKDRQNRLTLRSNALEIDLVPPEPGWTEAELRKAVATLEVPDPPRPQVGQRVDLQAEQARRAGVEAAARTLRFLNTPEAARAMARLYRHSSEFAQSELNAGLIASPYRKEAIAAMEAGIASPEVAVDSSYMGELIELVKLSRFGPIADYTPKTREEIARWIEEVQRPYQEKTRGVDAEYYARLAAAVQLKQGQAKAVSLETLSSHGTAPAPAETTAALVANFRSLPQESQARFLTMEWYRIASPAAMGLVQSIADSDSDLRDAALARLQQLNPEAARKIILERIRKLDISRGPRAEPRVLLSLPEKTLPELDDFLASAIERNQLQATGFAARYASAAIAPRVKAWVEQAPARLCSSPSVAVYFFRVDPDGTGGAMARARQQNPRSNCLVDLSPNEDLLMSPGLEKYVIAELGSSNPGIVRQAQTLLQYGGSAAAEKPLLEGLARWHETSSVPAQGGVEYGFVAALLNASRWAPSTDTLAKVLSLCSTDQCKKQVATAEREQEQPIGISFDTPVGFGGLMMGSTMLRSDDQLRERLAYYPQGTQFYVRGNGQGSWYFEQRTAAIHRIFEDAGMKVADPPAPVRSNR